jgi:hypothetical protein
LKARQLDRFFRELENYHPPADCQKNRAKPATVRIDGLDERLKLPWANLSSLKYGYIYQKRSEIVD